MQCIIQPIHVHVQKQEILSRKADEGDNLLDFVFSYIGIGRYFRGTLRNEPTNTT